MKLIFVSIFLLCGLENCHGGHIIKKSLPPIEKNNTNASFQVNVSAGYGVQQENINTTVVPTTHYFQEKKRRKEAIITNNNYSTQQPLNHQDQISQPSVFTSNQVHPTVLSYQVHEQNIPEVQEKTFKIPNINNKYRYNRHPADHQSNAQPSINEIQNVVNNLEHDQGSINNNYNSYGRPSKGSTIVEVVRVPAIYELHLKSGEHNPQRFVTLNPWLNKMNGFVHDTRFGGGYQYRPTKPKPLQHTNIQQQLQHNENSYNLGGFNNNLYADQPSFEQPQLSQLMQNLKWTLLSQQSDDFSHQPETGQLLQPRPQKITEIAHPVQQIDHYQLRQNPQDIKHHSYIQTNGYNNLELPQKSQEIAHHSYIETNNHNYGFEGPTSPKNLVRQTNHYRPTHQHKNHYHVHQDRHHIPLAESYKKVRQEVITPNHNSEWDYSHGISHEISNDYYKKPQALHEVPAPVLNKYQYNRNNNNNLWFNMKPTSSPSISYESPTSKPEIVTGLWVNEQENSVRGPLDNLQMRPITTSTNNENFSDELGAYSKGHVESVPTDYEQSYVKEQQQQNFNNIYWNQQSANAEIQDGNTPDYNDFTINVGNYLDQDLGKQQNEEMFTQEKQPVATFNRPQVFYNNEMYAMEPTKIETSEEKDVKESQQVFEQNIAPDINLLLFKNNPTVQPTMSTVMINNHEEVPPNLNYIHKFESMKINHAQKSLPKNVNYPRPFRSASNRRNTPMDYIIFIKERTVE